jgi:hypothetical protein
MAERFSIAWMALLIAGLASGCGGSGNAGADPMPVTSQDASSDDAAATSDGPESEAAFDAAPDTTGDEDAPVTVTGDFVVLAWNDLGMHCLNPRYDEAVILPPYNTLWAQVIRKGNPPEVMTAGLTVEYRFLNNTYSYGKTDSYGADFSQFWDHAQQVFGATLDHDKGLNLDDPNVHNGLTGTMAVASDHFHVNGVPITPVDDNAVWNPYQVAEITVKDGNGKVLAQTQATTPTSDEIDCAGCHKQGGAATTSIGGGDASPFHNILASHDVLHGTTLVAQKPVLCASCHGSPALGMTTPGPSGKFLSAAIHGSHAPRGATCYNCHPGATTQCSRSLAHTAQDGNCTTCHGTMDQVAQTITTGRVPWASEPACAKCHGGIAEVDTGAALYRNATGHGGVYCAGCHGSPHSMRPSREAIDNYQSVQYQGSPKTLGSCGACHDNSKGIAGESFTEQHTGPGAEHSACNVCHTDLSGDTSHWPHAFQWKAR